MEESSEALPASSSSEDAVAVEKESSEILVSVSQLSIAPSEQSAASQQENMISTASERPHSAGRQRTPVSFESISETSVQQTYSFMGNTKNLLAFDSDLQQTIPMRSESETDLIITELKDALGSFDQKENTASAAQKGGHAPEAGVEDTFKTMVSEETLEEARRRQQRRLTEQQANVWQVARPKRITHEEVIGAKVHEHLQRGVDQVDKGQFEAAISSFSKALNLRPADIVGYVERAEAYLQLCDFRSAYLNYKKAYSLDPDNVAFYNKLAFLAFMEGQCLFDQCLFSEALERFALAAEMQPSMAGYHMRAVACLAALGRLQECLALVSRRLELETTGNPELYVLRARLHLRFRNSTLAYYDVRDALSLDPHQPQAGALMQEMVATAMLAKQQAVTMALQDRLENALNKISTAIDTDPSVADLHIFRGSLHRRLNNFNEAIDDYLLAMDKCDHREDDPVFRSAQRQLLLTYNDFAVFCYHKNFLDEAVILLNKAVKGEKSEKGLYLNRGDCFFRLNDLGFALADYEQALELDPTSWASKCRIAVVHNELGIAAYQNRQYHEAALRFTQAIEHNPKVGQFYVHRARCWYMLHEGEDARDDVLISLHLDPENDEIIPLLTRLFPGRSVKEVLRSAMAEQARDRLAEVMRAAGATSSTFRRLPPVEHRSSSAPPCSPSNSNVVVAPPSPDQEEIQPLGQEEIQPLGQDTPTPRHLPQDRDLIREKRKVGKELKDLFRFPRSLKHTGPRVKSTLHPVPSPPAPEDPDHRAVYTWKTFNHDLSQI